MSTDPLYAKWTVSDDYRRLVEQATVHREALFASGGSRIVSVCCFVGVGSDTLDPDSGRVGEISEGNGGIVCRGRSNR